MGFVERAVIVDAIRTPIGRYGGKLKDVRPDDLAALVVKHAVERTKLDPSSIEDVPGCTRCDAARFFSFRRQREDGRMLAVIVAR